MLHFLVMADNRAPLRRHFREWGQPLQGRTRLLSYEDIADAKNLKDGTYIFCDIERLPPAGLAEIGRIWDSLSARGTSVRLLNSPHAVVRRRELLRTLFKDGSNHFNAYGLEDSRDKIRYPVFLRSEREHKGPLSPLLHDASALNAAIDGLIAAGRQPWDLLIVEFLDVSSNGIFHKYSVTKVGAATMSLHVFFSKHWVVKDVRDWPPEYVRADNAFIHENPHRELLEKVFRFANIDFGRADYALHDGRVQIFEINTNPRFLIRRFQYGPDRLPTKVEVADRLNAAMAALDDASKPPRLFDRLAGYMDLRR